MNWVFLDTMPWNYDVQTPRLQPLGGSQSALCYLAVALAHRGHNVSTLTDTTAPQEIEGVRCLNHDQLTADLYSAPSTCLVVLNGPAEVGLALRRELKRPVSLVLWTQHAWDQPAMRHLQDPRLRTAWDRVVCVSDWQQETMCEKLGFPTEQTIVLRNGISPSFENLFPDESSLAAAKASSLRLAYTSTPFRGLDVLLECYPPIRARFPDVLLDVFSSMRVYGETEDEDPYVALYDRCRELDGVRYHGSVPQPELARAMAGVSVLTYPNTFPETSCIAVLEALAAGAMVLTSDLGALRETCDSWGLLLPPISAGHPPADYISAYVRSLAELVTRFREQDPRLAARQFEQVQAITASCNWRARAAEWEKAFEAWP